MMKFFTMMRKHCWMLLILFLGISLPVRAQTHQETQNIFPANEATNTAVSSGDWNNPSNWSDGLPAPGDKVHIPSGFSVDVTQNSSVDIEWLRVDGDLSIEGGLNTEINMSVRTLLVTMSGSFNIGSEGNPVPSAYPVRIGFKSDIPINTPRLLKIKL